jgi:tetratricopeptide (TPR) repeat protein
LYDIGGNEIEAIKQLDLLIAKYPDNKSYLKTKARHLVKKNKVDEAMVLYKKVLTIDTEDTDANLAVLSKGDDKEKPSAYLMALLPIITNQSINIDVKVKELLPYIQNLKKNDNAEVKSAIIDLADKLVLTHPEEAKAYSLYGDVLMITGDINAAIDKYEHTLKLNNKNFAVWEQLMYAYLETQNYDALTKMSNQAIDLYPNQAINFFFASLCSSYKKNYVEAQSLAEEGLIVSGGNKVSLSKINAALGMAYLGKKELDKAESSVDTSISLSGNLNAFAYEIMGDIQLAKGNQAKAKENWKKSVDLGNKSKQLLAKIQ